MTALEAHSIQPLAPVTVQCTMMEPCVTVSLSLECHFSKQCSTVEPLYKGHVEANLFVLCKEFVLFGRRFKAYYNNKEDVFLEVYYTVSLFGRVHYWRFHSINV